MIKAKNSVLIADDDIFNVKVLTDILSSEYIVHSERNGRNVVKAAEKYLPDVILLDIVMPKMDGYAVIAALKLSEKTRDIPVIFITALSEDSDEEKGLALGAADYITKPFSYTTVRLRVRNQIEILDQLRANEYNIMKYRLTSNALNIALWDMDVVSGDPINPDNKFTWSQELRHMLGFSDERDFPNVLLSWSDRLHPEDKERTLNAFAAHLNDRTGKTPYDIEYRLMLKNGKYRYFHAFGATLRDNAGVPLRVAGALMDITEKKRMAEVLEEALNESSRTLENMISILNKSDAMIHVTDSNTDEILFMTDYMKQHFGAADDVIGQPCYKVLRGLNERCDFCPCLQLDKEPDKAFIWESHNPVTQCYYRNINRYVDWHDGRKVHIQFSTDLTDIKQAQETLEHREKMLSALNKMAAILLSQKKETFDDIMNNGLSPVAETAGLDRITIYRFMDIDAEKRFGQVYRWDKAGGGSVPVDDDLRVLPKLPAIENWAVVLSKGGVINTHTGVMSNDEAALLSKFGVKSILLTPVFINDMLWGVVTFQDHSCDRYFDDDSIEHLRSVAFLCADALVRDEMEHGIAEAEERTRLMLDASPLCCQIWDSDLKTIDCNEAGVRLYRFKNKQEYADRFFECSPEYQPDGQRSDEKAIECVIKAFTEGYYTFEWMHRIPDDGTPVPAEITLVRVKRADDYVVAGYTRDMREHYKMMKDIEYRDNLLQAVNHASAFLLNSDMEFFESVLYQSMKIMAEAVKVDRMHIWENYTVDGQLYCRQVCAWNEDAHPQQDKDILTSGVPYSAHFQRWEGILSNGECINNLARNAPHEEQEISYRQGILSVLVVPIFIKDKFWGFVGFDDCRSERIFTREEESILRSGGLLVANALLRNEMVVNIRDTSDLLKLAAEKAREDEERIQLMLDAMPLACHLLSRDIEVIYCNQEAVSLFGAPDKKEYRKKFSEIFPEFQPCGRRSSELAREHVDKAFDEGWLCVEWVYQKLGGDRDLIPCESTLVRVRHRGEEILAWYARDLREQKAVIEEMRRAEIAEESNNAKSRFLATMSHEIRTPMNSILGFAELAHDRAVEPQIKDYLDKITDNTKWLLRVIDDILDISKIESGKMNLENAPFDLHDLISRCSSVILPGAEKKGLDLRIYAEPLPGKKLLGDSVRLYQALINLLSNAVKFTDTGTVKFSSSVKDSSDSAATVYFEVKDSGIGMSSSQIEKIFEPFAQADSGTTRKFGGTGLGLAITKNIVELMGGKLEVESEPGSGSMFSFEIVFETTDAPDDMPDAKPELLEKPHFDGLVLVCDDNYMNQQVICEHLARVGLRATVADNGKMGVEKFFERIRKKEKPFDMIFMDMFMPVMDGMEATTTIREFNTGTPIVAMTANVMADELEKYRKNGMPDCLGKPFTSQELWRVLLKHLTPLSSSDIDEHEQAQDDELQKKLRVNFVKSNQNVYTEITGAAASGDIKLAHRLAHTLKGNAGQIGELQLQAAAAAVENMLSGGKNLLTDEQIGILETELKLVLNKLSPLLAEGMPGKEVRDEKEIRELFEKLESMLINLNPECINLLDDIRAVPGTEELARQIEDFEFKQAIDALSELKSSF